MKRLLTLILAIFALGGTLVVLSATPAQASLSSCPSGTRFGPGDSRLTYSPYSHVWYTPRIRASSGNCNGVFIRHDGHFSYINGMDVDDGQYRIITFRSDGTVNYTGPWTRFRVSDSVFRNIRPEISDGRVFSIQERSAPCFLSTCSSEHKPMLEMRW